MFLRLDPPTFCHTDSVRTRTHRQAPHGASHPPDGPRHGADDVGPRAAAGHRPAHAGAAPRRGGVRARDRASLPGLGHHQAGVRVSGSDGGAVRRSAPGDMGRNGPDARVNPGFPFWPSWNVYDSRLPAAMQRFSHCCQVRYSFRCRSGEARGPFSLHRDSCESTTALAANARLPKPCHPRPSRRQSASRRWTYHCGLAQTHRPRTHGIWKNSKGMLSFSEQRKRGIEPGRNSFLEML